MNNLPVAPPTNPPPTDQAHSLREKQALMERLLTIAIEIKADMPDDVTSDHGWLFGEDALPA